MVVILFNIMVNSLNHICSSIATKYLKVGDIVEYLNKDPFEGEIFTIEKIEKFIDCGIDCSFINLKNFGNVRFFANCFKKYYE